MKRIIALFFVLCLFLVPITAFAEETDDSYLEDILLSDTSETQESGSGSAASGRKAGLASDAFLLYSMTRVPPGRKDRVDQNVIGFAERY